jgi:hypothetical protein
MMLCLLLNVSVPFALSAYTIAYVVICSRDLPDIRKEQHEREQKWKATGRDQIKQNTNFDMARSLFGGGGPAPAADDSDDVVEEVVKKVEKVAIDDDEGDDEEGEQDYDEYEDVDEKDD